jgi:uncharacterized peroxidase-related enzyme
MSRLTLHTPESAPANSRESLQKAASNNGFLPHLLATLANSPASLETYLTVGEINARSGLTIQEREVVQITAASIHGCDFCVAGHSAVSVKKAGLTRAQTVALQQRSATGNERLDALATFTKAVIVSRGAVTDGELTDIRAAGFSDEQVLGVILGVSLATLCNFANNLAQNTLNPELEPFAAGVLTP